MDKHMLKKIVCLQYRFVIIVATSTNIFLLLNNVTIVTQFFITLMISVIFLILVRLPWSAA